MKLTTKSLFSIVMLMFVHSTYAVGATHEYKKYEIDEVASSSSSGASMNKIVIKEKDLTSKGKNFSKKSLWEITANLPLPADVCLQEEAGECDTDTQKLYKGSCYAPCIGYGPEMLAFDEKSNKIYFVAPSVRIGTGGGAYFVFAADIAKKKVDYLFVTGGPLDASLSPLGTNLVLYAGRGITIYDTNTKKRFGFLSENDSTESNEKFHELFDIKWLNDNQFSYHDGVRHSKFQGSHDSMREIVYDIPHKKVISSRTMAKTEYNSIPYIES